MIDECRRKGFVVGLALVAVAASGVDASALGRLDPGTWAEGEWTLVSPLGTIEGRWLLITGALGHACRCELAVTEAGRPALPDDLIVRRGRGWTLCVGDDGSTGGHGFVQSWEEGWQPAGPEALAAIAGILNATDDGQHMDQGDMRGLLSSRLTRRGYRERPERVVLGSWDGLPESWRPPDEGTTGTGGGLRRRLASIARGRGAEGLVLQLQLRGGELLATSVRWPGRLVLRQSSRRNAPTLPAEAFLPMWPMDTFTD